VYQEYYNKIKIDEKISIFVIPVIISGSLWSVEVEF
jgi:hypothetical protein